MFPAIQAVDEDGALQRAHQQRDGVQHDQHTHPTVRRELRGEIGLPPAHLVGKPEGQKVGQQEVAGNRDERGHQTLAVAEQQVLGGKRSLPAHLRPALQADAQRPARLLAVGGLEGVGKVFADVERQRLRVHLLGAQAEPALATRGVLYQKAAEDLLHAHAC
ncbi:hypothetical protein SDC9_76232 [bioreactor metagenome]|uniref:Uncharacterized protein n=1 Tax=bioreactor metagenome TaxID=1076179 RepID=A0A644YM41_9ZZZZ